MTDPESVLTTPLEPVYEWTEHAVPPPPDTTPVDDYEPPEPPANVDDAGVNHFLVINPDPGVPDLCGGCEREWPCPGAVAMQVVAIPRPLSAEEMRLQEIAVKAAREALGLPPEGRTYP